MKWIFRIVLGGAVVLALMLGVGAVMRTLMREEMQELGAGAAKVAQALEQEFKLRPTVTYSLKKSVMKGDLSTAEAYVVFQMIPPTIDIQALAERTALLAFEHMPHLTVVHLVGSDPRTPGKPYQVTLRPKLRGPPPPAQPSPP